MSGSTVRGLWRALVPARVRRLAEPTLALLGARRVNRALRSPEPELRPGPLIVSGLLAESKGISRAAHLTITGLQRAGLHPIAHDLRPVLSLGGGKAPGAAFSRPGGVWLLHINAPEAIRAMAALSPGVWRGRYRIGYWAYELNRVPYDWVNASRAFHEIWAPSQFVADSLIASGITRPIRVMPHPVGMEIEEGVELSPQSGAFAVIAMGDYTSSAERKNLRGAIEIYLRAFPQEAPSQRLLIKTHSSAFSPQAAQAIVKMIGTRQDITIVDRAMSHADVVKLIASCHLLLSPHRAEGFGLPLAEAFMTGVPALATGWSGNLEFMSDLRELLIGHSMTPVDDPYRVYKTPDLLWAEPDLEDAASKLRVLAAAPELRRALAARGRMAVEELAKCWSEQDLSATPWYRLVR